MNTLLILSYFAHNLSCALLIGYYLVLALILLPVLKKQMKGAELGKLLSRISNRMLPFIALTLTLFVLSGFNLMKINPAYQGFGQFNNPWCVDMLAKHGLVVVMIILGACLHMLPQIGLAKTRETETELAYFKLYQWLLIAQAAAGLLVLLLTAVAQTL